MSLSFDPKALETVAQFGAFVQLLQDPKALSATVESAKSTLASINAALGNLKTKEQVDSYVTAELAKLDEAKVSFEAHKVSMNAEVDAQVKKLTDMTNLVADKKSALDNRASELDSKERTMKDEYKELSANIALYEERTKAVDTKHQELQSKESQLDEKLSTVKKMLGEK